ncbi:hypothetical protein AB3R30_02315 [Leptolyngbyaceae cyanobacterium UHCC 1019]
MIGNGTFTQTPGVGVLGRVGVLSTIPPGNIAQFTSDLPYIGDGVYPSDGPPGGTPFPFPPLEEEYRFRTVLFQVRLEL